MRRVLVLMVLWCGAGGVMFAGQSGGKGDVGGRAEGACTRSAEAGFSYCPPAGWTIKATLESKFKGFFAPTPPPTPNILVDSTPCPALEPFASNEVAGMTRDPSKAGATVLTLLDMTELVTSSGDRLRRARFHLETASLSFPIRTMQYYFRTRAGECVIVTATTPESTAETNEALFDQAARTLRID